MLIDTAFKLKLPINLYIYIKNYKLSIDISTDRPTFENAKL